MGLRLRKCYIPIGHILSVVLHFDPASVLLCFSFPFALVIPPIYYQPIYWCDCLLKSVQWRSSEVSVPTWSAFFSPGLCLAGGVRMGSSGPVPPSRRAATDHALAEHGSALRAGSCCGVKRCRMLFHLSGTDCRDVNVSFVYHWKMFLLQQDPLCFELCLSLFVAALWLDSL